MDPRLAYARELERRDADVAARIEHVLALGQRADELRSRAEAVGAELARLPGDRARVGAAAADAERSLGAAHRTLVEAERAQAAASGEADESARFRVAQAATELRAADARHARLVARVAALEHDEERRRAEADELGRIAARLAAELERESRIASAAPPAADLPALQEWASRAHAAVLVARSGLESERDRIVREANELASSVLGEALQATSAASVRGQLERMLA